MTIPNTTDIATYTGSGTTGPFPFAFKILSTDQLRVFKTLVASPYTREELTLTTDYTVEITGPNAGEVTTVDAVTSSYTITILRAVEFKQESAFRTQGQQNAASWENAFDLACIQARQLKRETDSSIKIPITEDAVDELPSSALRANGFLAFDAAGAPMISTGVDTVPAGTTVAIVTTKAQLKAISTPSSAVTYLARGHSAIGDGGGGIFVWDSSSSDTDDGGTILQLNAGGVGRFKRVYDGYVNVKWFGATGDGTTDDTDAIDDANDFIGDATGTLYFPVGTYKRTAKLTITDRVSIRGDGRRASTLLFTHTGKGIEQVSPINSSTGIWTRIENIGVTCNNASNADAGIVDTGGTFVSISDVYVSGFLYGVVLDQSEVISVEQLDVLVPAYGGSGDKPRGLWITNGDDYTALASTYYTNRITIRNCNFNSGATANNYAIVDDGGVNHEIIGCNVNACETGIRAAGVRGLTIEENEIEGQGGTSVILCNTKLDAATYATPCIGVSVNKNTVATNGGAYNIDVQDVMGGSIKDNIFGNATGIILSQNPHPGAGLTIEGNAMTAFISAGAFTVLDASTSAALYRHTINQQASSRISSSITAGARQVTPASMFGITVGKTLSVVNSNGTNPELVMVTGTNATTFNATFSTDKGANSVIFGTDPYRESTGTWTPTLIGSGANGTHTYSTRKGFYHRIGKKISATCNLVISAKDAALNGTLSVAGLPFSASTLDGTISVCPIPLFSGFNFAGGSNVLGGIVSGSQVDLRKSGTNTTLTTVPDGDISGNAVSLYFTVDYFGNP